MALVVHTYNFSTGEAEVGDLEFESSLSCRARLCFE